MRRFAEWIRWRWLMATCTPRQEHRKWQAVELAMLKSDYNPSKVTT